MSNLTRALAIPLGWLQGHWVSPADIRAETWALGVRHRGEVLDGARREAVSTTITVRRAVLLKAVIRNQNLLRRAEEKLRLFGRRGATP